MSAAAQAAEEMSILAQVERLASAAAQAAEES